MQTDKNESIVAWLFHKQSISLVENKNLSVYVYVCLTNLMQPESGRSIVSIIRKIGNKFYIRETILKQGRKSHEYTLKGNSY